MELVLKNLTKKYKSFTALDRMSLSFTNGVYGILGANGAGKSTMFKLICGLIKPTGGAVMFNGKNIRGKPGAYYKFLGYLPQAFGYYPAFTAEQFLRYISEVKGVPANVYKKRIRELLELVSLEDAGKKKIKDFSGGMKRRLGIAQALLNEPKILVLDEPTVGLDPKERVYFRNVISELSKETIVLLSTHISTDIEYIANEIILLHEGKTLVSGTLAQLSQEVAGRVWICRVAPEEANAMSRKFFVVNVKNNAGEGRSELRILSDAAPAPSAEIAEPTLEDVYLYHFSK